MNLPNRAGRLVAGAFLLLSVSALGVARGQQHPPIIQPGAPGEPGRQISAEEAADLAGLQVTEADVKFMQGMISHHAQALTMTAFVASRSTGKNMRALAKRIELSQEDEIKMMQDWLRSNGHEATTVDAHHAHDAELMPGMLTTEQMRLLEEAQSIEFDRLFLELMIAHHQGALVMVEDLLSSKGAAQEPTVFAFTSDITADQSMEIDRMAAMLAGFSNDPRVGLRGGFRDAEEAILNLELVASLPKPPGFFSPDTPQGLPVPPEKEDDSEKPDEDSATTDASDLSTRAAPLLRFANSDLAFSADVLFEGNFHGFNTYDISVPTAPRHQGSVVCPGGQGDVSVVGDLLILSVEQTRGRLDCGLQGVAEPTSQARFRGLRIFDISDSTTPVQVAAVQTCRGSHTHTVVADPDDEGNLYVYGSGTGSVRPEDELSGCSDAHPGEDENTALFSIDVIQIPIERPEASRVVSRPRVFADPESGAIAGLWKGGDHGRGTQTTSQTNQCHDITVFSELGLAAGACSGNGILLDVSDPVKPVRLDQVTDQGFAYWHSATFNNDGTKVIFTDEWGGGMRPRCRASDPKQWGANAIFDIVDRELRFRSYFKMSAPQTEFENCVAHNGALIPVPGRDIMVQAWYQGGISVFDFTDSANPVEIAFFDRGPMDATQLLMGGYWSAYWYNGYIYGTEIARGLDVLRLSPSDHLSRSEIEAASLVKQNTVNAQQQRRIDWPANSVVARAYLDQLVRSQTISPETAEALAEVLEQADQLVARSTPDQGPVAAELEAFATQVEQSAARGRDQARLQSLSETLRSIAASLR